MTETVGQLPRYKCHKEVWALKIKEFNAHNNTITPEEEGYAPFQVSIDYVLKHDPKPGGYFVVYKDGYQSYSPAVAFEEGYTAIDR